MSLLSTALSSVKERIADRDHWTRFAPARDESGRAVHPTHTAAVSWSLEGALYAETRDLDIVLSALELLDQVAVELYATELRIQHVDEITKLPVAPLWSYVEFESVGHLNDHFGHQAILRVLERAIEVASER